MASRGEGAASLRPAVVGRCAKKIQGGPAGKPAIQGARDDTSRKTRWNVPNALPRGAAASEEKPGGGVAE